MSSGGINKRLFQNIVKLFHIVSSVCVMGGFLAMLMMLLTRDMSSFQGQEILYDKTVLMIFNTLIIYGAIMMAITILCYTLFTEWGFLKYRFIIIKWVMLLGILGIAWFVIGRAISGMASISDAGLHMSSMTTEYIKYRNQAVIGLIFEVALLLGTMFLSIRKPFGKRNTKPFKYHKAAVAILIPCSILGIALMIFSEVSHLRLRNTPIKDIDLATVSDGDYEGTSKFGNYTYEVLVSVKDHQITEIKDLKPRDSIYVVYATGVFEKIKKEQTPNVDAITGATTTSKAFMKAVENALDKKN